MRAKKGSARNGAPVEKLDAVRELIMGPRMRELERKVERLAQQVGQIQANLDVRNIRQTRRAARHRYLTTMKVKKLGQAVDTILQHLRAETAARAASAQKLDALTRLLRELPQSPQLKSVRSSATRTHKKTVRPGRGPRKR